MSLLRKSLAVALAMGLPTYAMAARLHCVPTYPVYCANVHLTCVGHSRIATPEFQVVATSDRAWVSAADETQILSVKLDRGAMILRGQAQGYLKIGSDGQFSQRIYVDDRALMSIGSCVAQEAISQ